MFLTDSVDAAIIIASGGGIGAIITGFFTVRASKDAREIKNKVGNGWTERLGETLGDLQSGIDKAAEKAELARRAAHANNQVTTDIKSSVDTLSGKFDQHITQHQWRDK